VSIAHTILALLSHRNDNKSRDSQAIILINTSWATFDCPILTFVSTREYNIDMNAPEHIHLTTFLRELMHRRGLLPSQLAADIGISHSTVSRWLKGQDLPSTKSCQCLAEYSGVSLYKILALCGHVPAIVESPANHWPEFREYARQKYANELDEDLITLIERLIEQRRGSTYRGSEDS
jgi:transcriptional regulator with XRE-family HTH domain